MREFEFIEKYLKPLAGPNSFGLQDDCAYFDGYAITKDVLVAGTHFFEDDAPFDLARKSLRVNLSDLASCGAKPFGFTLGLALPRNISEAWLGEFTNGLAADIKLYDFQMLGGDTTTHDGKLVISITALGKTNAPIMRSGAKEGENIFVSGAIGAGYSGLKERAGKYILPEPRIELGISLRGRASSCIDISDGLLADLGHICKVSGVGAELDSAKIPLASGKYSLMEQITGGDDYELCFTSAEESFAGCTKIGRITGEKNIIMLDGSEVEPKGYQHKLS